MCEQGTFTILTINVLNSCTIHMETSMISKGLFRMPMATLSFLYPGTFRASPQLLGLLASNRHFSISSRSFISTEHLPRVVQPSIWQSIIPKSLRRSREVDKPPKSKEWNPATIYIVLALLVGSQAIHLITLRREMASFTRKADAKIALLREIIERVQKGEDVDVEGLLGTGNKEKEKEWEEALKDIEQEDALWQTKKRGKQRESSNPTPLDQSPPISTSYHTQLTEEPPSIISRPEHTTRKSGPGFY